MHTVTSTDGSTIAYDRSGEGPVVILVGGALSYRKFFQMEEIAAALAEHCTVINYDRRAAATRPRAARMRSNARSRTWRRSSTPRAARLAVGLVVGWALALRAAAAGIGVERVSVHEVPFMVQPGLSRPTRDYGERIDELLAAGDATASSSTSCATRSASRLRWSR